MTPSNVILLMTIPHFCSSDFRSTKQHIAPIFETLNGIKHFRYYGFISLICVTKFGYNMALNKMVMTKVYIFFDDPSMTSDQNMTFCIHTDTVLNIKF